ncbi:MAG: PASTA domain-containing protein [Pyrinomonadaceae bacterium]|jgi:hypothetical protein|nr:PASTA domain-containing protein [Pyrinomonadaceae bacterium]
MRFLLGVLVGYSMRGKRKLLITILATVAFILYIVLPLIALLALRLDVQRERQSRPAQTRVPALKGLSYENAETKLHASNLNIRLLATRYDLPLHPGLIVDQVPQPGEEVIYGLPCRRYHYKSELPWPVSNDNSSKRTGENGAINKKE